MEAEVEAHLPQAVASDGDGSCGHGSGNGNENWIGNKLKGIIDYHNVVDVDEKSNANDDIQIGGSTRNLYSGEENDRERKSDIESDGHQHKQTRDPAELAYYLHKMVKNDSSQSQSRHANVNYACINHENRISSASFMSDNSVGCCDIYEEFCKQDLNATPENGFGCLEKMYNIDAYSHCHRSAVDG